MEFILVAQKFVLKVFMKGLQFLLKKFCSCRYASLSKLENGKIVELHCSSKILFFIFLKSVKKHWHVYWESDVIVIILPKPALRKTDNNQLHHSFFWKVISHEWWYCIVFVWKITSRAINLMQIQLADDGVSMETPTWSQGSWEQTRCRAINVQSHQLEPYAQVTS